MMKNSFSKTLGIALPALLFWCGTASATEPGSEAEFVQRKEAREAAIQEWDAEKYQVRVQIIGSDAAGKKVPVVGNYSGLAWIGVTCSKEELASDHADSRYPGEMPFAPTIQTLNVIQAENNQITSLNSANNWTTVVSRKMIYESVAQDLLFDTDPLLSREDWNRDAKSDYEIVDRLIKYSLKKGCSDGGDWVVGVTFVAANGQRKHTAVPLAKLEEARALRTDVVRTATVPGEPHLKIQVAIRPL